MSSEKETRAAIDRFARRLKKEGLGSFEKCQDRARRSAQRHDRRERETK